MGQRVRWGARARGALARARGGARGGARARGCARGGARASRGGGECRLHPDDGGATDGPATHGARRPRRDPGGSRGRSASRKSNLKPTGKKKPKRTCRGRTSEFTWWSAPARITFTWAARSERCFCGKASTRPGTGRAGRGTTASSGSSSPGWCRWAAAPYSRTS